MTTRKCQTSSEFRSTISTRPWKESTYSSSVYARVVFDGIVVLTMVYFSCKPGKKVRFAKYIDE